MRRVEDRSTRRAGVIPCCGEIAWQAIYSHELEVIEVLQEPPARIIQDEHLKLENIVFALRPKEA